MTNASTAIVKDGLFFHYCHQAKSLMALRIHHSNCPLCSQKNPDYIPNEQVFTVSNLSKNSVILVFASPNDAIKYIQKHPHDNLALGDTGFVSKKPIIIP